jgi:hypothetical protein
MQKLLHIAKYPCPVIDRNKNDQYDVFIIKCSDIQDIIVLYLASLEPMPEDGAHWSS